MNRLLVCLATIFFLTSSAFGQQWSKYIPEKQRKDILKKSARGTKVGGAFGSLFVNVVWINDSTARAMVSTLIDRERLTPDEADARYLKFRPSNSFLFLVFVFRSGISPLGESGRAIVNPLLASETFLQRADDHQKFAKAEVADHDSDLFYSGLFGAGGTENTYKILFPRADRSGSPIVRDIADKIELQFNLAGKKVVLEYKLGETASRIEDL